MKVLWFANTACSAAKKLGLHEYAGGWLSSLEAELNRLPGVELAVCFYINRDVDHFIFGNTKYFPVVRKRKQFKVSRFLADFFANFENTDKKELVALNNIIEQYQPDVIHVHGSEDNFGLIAETCKIPIVISIQGLLTIYAEKYFDGIPFSIVKKYERPYNKLIRKTFSFKFALFQRKSIREKRILKMVNYVFGRTEWDKHATSILSPQSKYFVSNEILRTPFYNNVWSKTQFHTPLQIVTTLSDSLYKGFETIVNTCNVLLQQTGLSFEWHILGITHESDVVRLVHLWKNAEPLNIYFHGQKDENQIMEFLKNSDIYVQPSHIENSPNSLCEAMALGMPIIASFAGGTNSLLEHNKEGLLFQPGEHYSLAGKILYLSANFQTAAEMAVAARKRAILRHNKEEIITSLLEKYNKMIIESKSLLSK
jgi:glycosyltransferase involved in cell wall biosynthesis